ncbi:MAG: ABC transporter substrate binding protein [Spirochaetaceae bacterium]
MSMPALIPFGRAFVLALLSFLLLSLPDLSATEETTQQRVLYINSYHPGYQWGDRLLESFRAALGRDVELYVEYMDTKRFLESEHAERFLQYLEAKYRDVEFDGIVAADDAAYQLCLESDSSLFKDAPTVFCGVSEFRPSQMGPEEETTGVVQHMAIEETMNLLLTLHPEAPAIVVLTDNTLNGLAHAERVRRFARFHGVRDRLILPNAGYSATLDSIRRLLEVVPRNSVIYYLAFDVQATGTEVTPEEVFSVLNERPDLPVYVSGTTYFAAGGVGGKLVTPEHHGNVAAEMTMEILGGTSPRDIPIVQRDTSRFVFDARQLRRHGIYRSELPPGSTLRNTLLDRFARSRHAVAALASALGALLLLLGALLLIYRTRARSARELTYERELFGTLMDQVPILIYFKDLQGRFVRVNPGYAAYMGHDDIESILGKSDEDLYPKEFAAGQRRLESDIMRTGEGVVDNLEEHKKPDGSRRWFLATKMPWTGSDGSIRGIVGISQEVTAEIETNRALKRALEEREILLKEVHHRTKNNLQLVLSMLNLQKHSLETESAKEALGEATNRVHSMAMLHEHLYRSPDVAQLKLGEYLEAILSHTLGLARSDLALTTEVETDHCLVDLERGVHIGLIVNELLTNAVKHAFPGRRCGRISLTVRNGRDGVMISIADDGVGFAGTTARGDGASMGMQIVHALTEQIGGTLELSEKSGAVWTLLVPRTTPSLP